MTLIRFSYQQTYHVPATGTVVFMPHRRHAANETETLPRPFHHVLVDGETTVDLEPTTQTWVWSVTHNNETLYYTIPDQDGVIDHVDLVPIAPSTLPTANNAVEPAWWAEHRNTVNLIRSLIEQHDDAMSLLRSSATDFTTALQDAARHESVAGAYSRQAQASNEQAWQASKAPGGFAEQAESEADRARIYRDEANTHRVEAGVEANRAETHATNARADYERIQEYTEGWDSLDDAISDARDEADRAEVQADRASSEADRAEQTITNSISEWQPITLQNGWKSAGSSTTPEWRIFFDNIQIRGSLNSTEATDSLIGTLIDMPNLQGTTTLVTESSPGYSRIRFHNNGDMEFFGDIGDGLVRITLNDLIPLA